MASYTFCSNSSRVIPSALTFQASAPRHAFTVSFQGTASGSANAASNVKLIPAKTVLGLVLAVLPWDHSGEYSTTRVGVSTGAGASGASPGPACTLSTSAGKAAANASATAAS